MRGWLAACLMAYTSVAAAKMPAVGDIAPPYTLITFDKRTVTSEELRGKVVLLNFWATWCGPCKTEMPTIDAYYQLSEKHGLRVFAVTVDEVPDRVLKPLAGALAMPLVRRIRGPYGPIGHAVPTSFIIDRAGVVRYAKAGAFNLDDLNRLLVPLLNEPAP